MSLFNDNNFRKTRQEFGCPACGCQRVNRTETKSITTLYGAIGQEIEVDETNLGNDDPGYCDNCGTGFDEDKWAADINRQ